MNVPLIVVRNHGFFYEGNSRSSDESKLECLTGKCREQEKGSVNETREWGQTFICQKTFVSILFANKIV